MTLKHRLRKLESVEPTYEPIEIIRVIVDVGQAPVNGYQFQFNEDYIRVMRMPSESDEALKTRAVAKFKRLMPDTLTMILHSI